MKKICLICEGSYPYVVGGVSSWIQELIGSNPEYQFIILSIIPSNDFARKKYTLPDNVLEVKNIILNSEIEASRFKVFKNNLKKQDKIKEILFSAMDFNKATSKEFLETMETLVSSKLGNPLDVIISNFFWEGLVDNYQKNYSHINFNTYYWTYRNLYLNLLMLMKSDIPDADLYHTVATGYSGFVAAVAGYNKRGKVLLTEHGIYPREREEEIIKANWIDEHFKPIWIDFFYYLSKLTYDYSDMVISLFEFNRDLQVHYGANEAKVKVIPNGVDTTRFDKIVRRKQDGFHVGAVLRVVPIKDIKMMLKSIKIAQEKIPKAHFYLIGPTDENEQYYEECKTMVKDFGMEEYLTFTGRAQVDDYYAFLDLLLLSSISEGQPLSILEGLATGIPFVATDVGNCKEILLEKTEIGKAGIVVAPTDYNSFAEGIIKLYNNPILLENYGSNGRKIVNKYYTKEVFINSYKELYSNFLDNN